MKIVQATLLLLLTALVASGAEPGQRQVFAIAGHGSLSLVVPSGWKASVKDVEAGAPPTITLTETASGTKLLMTAIWSPRDDPQFTTAESIRGHEQQGMEVIQAGAVETKLVLREISTKSGKGYYFWATDRAPKPGEFEYLANGIVPCGSLLLDFTALTHRAPPEGIETALSIVRSVELVP